jgi:hypothetical protein
MDQSCPVVHKSRRPQVRLQTAKLFCNNCGSNQRQSTLDCRYLTLLCDNLKKIMFLFWEFVMFFQFTTSFHCSTAKQKVNVRKNEFLRI